MLPTPTMPSVLPASSLLPTMRLAPQAPRRVGLSISRVRFTQASMSISACSATAWEFEPGAWTTATPSRVAAGTSTVSRPTPCRPTTLSFGQRAIRLSVQLGRRRNRIPAASAATLTSPASVSSSQTTTRASLSRSDLPSGLIGPASTTRGRDWVAIERVSFLWRSGLFAGDENQARGVQREGRALEPAVELHPAPALRPQHRRELVGGVEADLALPDQLPRALLRLRRRALEAPPPRAPAARRGIELVLDAERPAAYALALLGRQRPHQLISIPGIEDEDAAWPERAPESIGHQAVLVVGEIADRAEEVDREVELARELHVTDVLADEPERDAGLGGGLPRAVELGLAEVDAGHLVAASRELDRVTAESARRVEDACARVERRDADHPLDVARRVRRRLERLRDLGPRLAKEPLAVEHGGHCSGLREGGLLRGWPEPGATRRCCNGVRVVGASRGWPEPGATRLRAACDIFRLMATLVTGAFGCIGSWVVRGLLAGGERPVVFDVGDDPWRPRMIAGDDVARRITIVRGDIADRDALVRVVRHHAIRRIIHLAAWQVPLCRQDPSRGALVNVVGTANVFEAARASEGRVERVGYASSAAVFGAPDLYPPGPIKDDAPRRH